MKVRTADGVTIEVNTNDRDEAARVAHQAYLRRQEAPSGINRPRSAIRGTGARIEGQGRNEATQQTDREYSRGLSRQLGWFENVPRILMPRDLPGSGDYHTRLREGQARTAESLSDFARGVPRLLGSVGTAIGNLPVNPVRAGEERLTPYERLRLMAPERRARVRELEQRAERDSMLAAGYTPEQAATPLEEIVITGSRLGRRNVLSPEQQRQLPRVVNDAGHVAANVGHVLTSDLPRAWGDVGEAQRDRQIQARADAASQRIAEREGYPDLARAFDDRSQLSTADAGVDNAFSAAELIPGGAAFHTARAGARNAFRLARREIPQMLRAPARRAAEEAGPLTREGSRVGLGAGLAGTGGSALLLAPNNAAAATLEATPDPKGGYRVPLPDGRVMYMAEAESPDEAVRAASRLIPNEPAAPIAGGAVGSMALSALTRRALPRNPRIGAGLGAIVGGAGGGVIAGGGFKSDEDAALGAGAGATQLAMWELGALIARRRAGVRLTPEQQARVAELEARFGRLTEGQRTGNIDQLQLEDQLRSGHVGDRAAATMLTHDAEAGRELQQSAMDIVARGQEPLTSDVGDAGRQYVESMRTTREAMREAADAQYATAMDLARGESLPAGLNRMPSAAIEEAAYAGDFAVPPAVQSAISRLESKIKDGAATHQTVERTRQELNALLREASFRRGADERHISNAIGALDEWQSDADVLRNPKARAAMTEARAMWEEQARLFEPQGRSQSATGHVLRGDVAGRAMDRLINEETTGRQALDTALGAGFASSRGEPGRQALGITRRTRAIGARALKYTNRNAPSGVRVPGRMSLGEDEWSALDMNTDRSQRFATDRTVFRRLGQLLADGLDNDAITATMRREGLSDENLGHVIRQIREGRLTHAPLPSEELQTLREGAWHKVMEPLSDYLRAVETHRVQGAGFLPAQRLVSQLDAALNKGGREIMEALYTSNEVREMRDLLEHMGRMIPPHGVSRSGSNVWLKHFGSALMNFIRHIPLAGPVIGVVGDMAAEGNAVRQAQRAIRPPRRANLPRVTPGAAAVGSGAAAGGAGLLAANEANAQEQSQELAAAQERVRHLEAELDIFSSVNASDPDSVRRAQQALLARGLDVAVDGRLGGETARAIREHRTQVANALEPARQQVEALELQERSRATRAGPTREALREFGPWAAMAAGAYLGHRSRLGAVKGEAARLAQRNARVDALLTPGPVSTARSAAAGVERLRRATNINEFWRAGGAGERVPYAATGAENGFKRRTRAAEPSDLFPSQAANFRTTDVGVIGASLGEAGGSFYGLQLAEAELSQAQAAVDRDPSEANLVRLERARDMVAIAQTGIRAGLGIAGARAGGALIHAYPRLRPNIAAAEQERMLLDQFTGRKKKPRLPRKR